MKFPSSRTRVLFLVLMLVGAHVAVYAADCPTCLPTFGSPVTAFTGSSVSDLVTGDFNGDGRADIAVANRDADSVVIVLGKGDGDDSFEQPRVFAAGDGPVALATGDFNGDGKLDLATANRNSKSISILFGDGTGNLGAASDITFADPPSSLVAGDFNGNGKLDIAVNTAPLCTIGAEFVSICFPSSVTVLLGDGAGHFTSHTTFSSASGPATLLTADFNSDLKLDLVSSAGLVFFGDGTGSFGAPVKLTPDPPRIIDSTLMRPAIADFNGDGRPDVAFATFTSIQVFTSDGAGGFTLTYNPNLQIGSNQFLVAANLDGDSKIDLIDVGLVPTDVPPNPNLGPFSLQGVGAGRFAQPARIDLGSFPSRIAIADFDGDGRPDIASANTASVTVVLNTTVCNQPTVCVRDLTVTEGDSGATDALVEVVLSAASNEPVTVNFAATEYAFQFTEIKAKAGADFLPVSGTLTFNPGVTTQTVTIAIVGDRIKELSPKNFVLTLSNPVNARLIPINGIATPLVRIVDNDPHPTLSISDATVIEGNGEIPLRSAVFTITASHPVEVPLSVQIVLSHGTTTSNDISGVLPLVAFDPGMTSRTLSVPIIGDTQPETDEFFFITLNPGSSGVPIGRARGVGTILDDDSAVDPAAPQLITEPGMVRAVALDALVHTTGPFNPINNNYFVSDKRTRITLFARNVNFSAGEDPLTALQVKMRDVDPDTDPNTHPATVEFVGPLAGADGVTQIIVKLPENFTVVGDKLVSLSLHNLTSNRAVIVLRSTVSATN